jgi:hypothetical protein
MSMKKNSAEPKNGMKRNNRPNAKQTPARNALREKVHQLTAEVERLREENALLKKNLVSLLHEDIPVDKGILKKAAKGPSIVEMIAELKNSGD